MFSDSAKVCEAKPLEEKEWYNTTDYVKQS